MNTDVIFGYHFYSPHNSVLLNQTRWLDLTCWRSIRVASETLVLTSRVSCHVGSWPVNSCAMTANCCSTEVFNLSRWCLLINTARTSISKRPVTQFKKRGLAYLPTNGHSVTQTSQVTKATNCNQISAAKEYASHTWHNKWYFRLPE